MSGIIDTAADVPIMGGEMFKKVSAVVKLCEKDFKPADKTPYNYEKKPFRLDGNLELDVSFQDRTMTDIYVKMDALEPLLLSEGVSSVWNSHLPPRGQCVQPPAQGVGTTVSVPTVKVQLVQSVNSPPKLDQSIVADVTWE